MTMTVDAEKSAMLSNLAMISQRLSNCAIPRDRIGLHDAKWPRLGPITSRQRAELVLRVSEIFHCLPRLQPAQWPPRLDHIYWLRPWLHTTDSTPTGHGLAKPADACRFMPIRRELV
jgi:hypothetical protein